MMEENGIVLEEKLHIEVVIMMIKNVRTTKISSESSNGNGDDKNRRKKSWSDICLVIKEAYQRNGRPRS